MRHAVSLLALLPAAAAADEGTALRVSSAFGTRIDPIHGQRGMHRGVDLPARSGTPVLAAAAGVVRVAGWRGGYGNLVEVRHRDGSATRYAHLSGILVRPGEAVSQGQPIAQIGSTGRSTGAHLHFEYRVGGVAVDPLDHLAGGTPHVGRADVPEGPPAGVHHSRFALARAGEQVTVPAGLPAGDTVQRSLAS